MSELVDLLKLQQALREAAENVAEAAERHSDLSVLRLQVEILQRCVRLDRDITLLSREILARQSVAGVA